MSQPLHATLQTTLYPRMKHQSYTIGFDDLADEQVAELLEQHRIEMLRYSPPESSHALDSKSLKHPDLTFWSARDDNNKVLGCIALKRFNYNAPTKPSGHPCAEIKSMKVDSNALRTGVGQALLRHLLEYATENQFCLLALETGSQRVFDPARRLYEAHGFSECEPFGSYQKDPHSVFYKLLLN